MSPARRVLVTGGGGYLGSQVVAALAGRGTEAVVSLDVREAPPERRLPGTGDTHDPPPAWHTRALPDDPFQIVKPPRGPPSRS